jgi:hypothetical protein
MSSLTYTLVKSGLERVVRFGIEFKCRNHRSIKLIIDADADVEIDSEAGHVKLRGQ